MSAQTDVYYDRSLDPKNRITYRKVWMRPPGLNADIQSTSESVNMIVDTEFELLGVNAVSADATIDTTGGFKLATHGGSVDSSIVLPHLDASQSAWATTLWDTAKSPSFEVGIKSGTVITLAKYWLGFKLTNTPTIATDDDQVFFTYSTAVGAGIWQYNYSIAGTDVAYTIPLDVVAAVAVSTYYQLRIEVYSDRTHMGFINDVPIRAARFSALTSLTTLIPYCGVISLTDAVAKNYTIKYLECGRAI